MRIKYKVGDAIMFHGRSGIDTGIVRNIEPADKVLWVEVGRKSDLVKVKLLNVITSIASR